MDGSSTATTPVELILSEKAFWNAVGRPEPKHRMLSPEVVTRAMDTKGDNTCSVHFFYATRGIIADRKGFVVPFELSFSRDDNAINPLVIQGKIVGIKDQTTGITGRFFEISTLNGEPVWNSTSGEEKFEQAIRHMKGPAPVSG